MSGKFKVVPDVYTRINILKNQKKLISRLILKNENYISLKDREKLSSIILSDYINTSRLVNRCVFTGRSRSVFRFFRLNRMIFKYLAVNGLIQGVRKASW